MNTVGNLGGFAAGFLTGWILDLAKAPAVQHSAKQIASAPGGIGSPTGAGGQFVRSVFAVPLAQVRPDILEAVRAGWTVSFILFGAVYVIATLLWLCFDSTKTVVPEQGVHPNADSNS